MRGGCLSFIVGIIVLALMVCLVCWMFITDFIIFDILLTLGLIALSIVIVLVAFVIVIWVVKELFG
jgi:hypothetical protein